MVEAVIGDIRVRSEPGTSADVLAALPEEAVGLVELGPLHDDGFAWYRVQYSYMNSSGVTDGGQGWIASGWRSSPWFLQTDDVHWDHGAIQGFAGSNSATVGPAQIPDQNYGLRWAAIGTACAIDIVLDNGTEQVLTVSTPVQGYAEGELASDFFIDHPALVGSITIQVQSSCEWAVSVVQFIG